MPQLQTAKSMRVQKCAQKANTPIKKSEKNGKDNNSPQKSLNSKCSEAGIAHQRTTTACSSCSYACLSMSAINSYQRVDTGLDYELVLRSDPVSSQSENSLIQ